MISRRIFSVVGGLFISTVLGIITVNLIPRILNTYGLVLIGGLFAGYIAKDKGWLYGSCVSIINWVIRLLIPVGPTSSPMRSIASFFSFLYTNNLLAGYILSTILNILCGTLGGWIGQVLEKRGRG